MTFEEFEIKYKELENEIKDKINEPENGREVITDGVTNLKKYFESKIRIAWLLKEPYDEKNGEGGGWSFSDMFNHENLYQSVFKLGHKPTWHPIIYVSHGILNNFTLWDEMPYIRNKNEMCDVVRDIAIINMQKLPSKNRAETNHNDLVVSINKYGDLLKRQIELLNPNVLIGANTLGLYKKMFNLGETERKEKNSIKYYLKDDKIYIDAYHPGQTKVKRVDYVDDIVESVEEWYSTLKKV